MAEVARFFDAVLYSEGDQAEVQARWARDGVLAGYASELAVSSGGAGLVAVASGEAFVQGFWYRNTATKTLAITANLSATARVDRVVLRLDRVANTLLAVIHEGVLGGGTPALTQVDGGVWELSLATISTASGVSTITDARVWQSNIFNPMTTGGDIIIADSVGRPIRKAKGANSTFLGVDGSGNLGYSLPLIPTAQIVANALTTVAFNFISPASFAASGGSQVVTIPTTQIVTGANTKGILMVGMVRGRISVVNAIFQAFIGLNGVVTHELGTFNDALAGGYLTFSSVGWANASPSTTYTMDVIVVGNTGTINIDTGYVLMLEIKR